MIPMCISSSVMEKLGLFTAAPAILAPIPYLKTVEDKCRSSHVIFKVFQMHFKVVNVV